MASRALLVLTIFGLLCAAALQVNAGGIIRDWKSCSDIFCRFTPDGHQSSDCSDIIYGANECTCEAESLQPLQLMCQNFVLQHLLALVNTDSLWSFNRTKLSVVIRTDVKGDFQILSDSFFNYLAMTNITDFAFTQYCGIGEICKEPNIFDSPTEHPYIFDSPSEYPNIFHSPSDKSLLLLGNYTLTNIESLKLTQSCIKDTKGSFSFVFPHVTDLNLTQNHFHFLSDGVFEGLIFVERLDLSRNKLGNLGNGSVFRSLSSLKYLDLTCNQNLTFTRNCFDELVNLQVLNISYNNLDFISQDIFTRNTELRVLDMSSCQIGSLKFETETSQTWLFDGLTKLEFLSLDNNKIINLPHDIFKSNNNLITLSLRANSFIKLSDVTQHLRNILLNLDLSQNCIRNDTKALSGKAQSRKNIKNFKCHLCCLDTRLAGILTESVILTVDYRSNPIQVLDMDFLQKIGHLKTVFISDKKVRKQFEMQLPQISNEYHVPRNLTFEFNLSYPLYGERNGTRSETQIIVSEYSFEKCNLITAMRINWNITQAPNSSLIRSGMKFLLNNIIVGFKKYQSVFDNFSFVGDSTNECNFTFYCPQQCTCQTKGFSPSTVVNCTGQSLINVPQLSKFSTSVIMDLSENRIRDFQHVTTHDWLLFVELYLNNNRLENLENLQLGQNLLMLDLRNNRLIDFSSLRLLLLPMYPVQIKVSQNPWRCDCHTPAIKNFMNTKKVVDFHEINCTSVYSSSILSLARASYNELCLVSDSNQLILVIVLPVFAILVISLSISIIMCYRYKDFLKLWLFTRGCCLWWVTEDDVDANKIYDAFVSYSSLDEDWVGTNLVPGLENARPAYKLCLHSRDWPVGDWIIKQIFKSVKESRRTIIVLTENFVDSMWSRMEFDAAYQQALTDQINRVLVVVPGEVPNVTKLGNEFKHFVTLNTYIKWKDPYFWRKLRCAMPRVKQWPELTDDQRMTNV